MKKYLRSLMVLAVMGLFITTQLGNVIAQSNALAITPRKDYTLEPGESVNDTLSITNRNTQDTLNLELKIVDFQAQDETGTPLLLRNANEKTPWSIDGFVDLPEQVVVAPGETVRVPISVSVPTDAGAGSYYSAIEYSAVNDLSDEQVNISASGVTLMFVNVPGQAKQQLTFEQFGAFIPDSSGLGGSFAGLFFGERPKVMAYRLTNDGNIAEQPNASILIKNNSGEVVYNISDANPKDQIALRGQTRRFDSCIVQESINQTTTAGGEVNTIICGDTDFAPGRYTAELSIVYGENGNETREITARATFWYLPWWFVGLVVAGLLIVVGAVVYIVRRVKDVRSRKTRRR